MSIPGLTFKQNRKNKRVKFTNQISATQTLLNHRQTDGDKLIHGICKNILYIVYF